MRIHAKALFLTVLMTVAFSGKVHATPLIDFTGSTSTGSNGYNYTLGYSFSLSASTTIDALGVFDANSDGLSTDHQVGLWTSTGTLLASTSVGPGATLFDASTSGLGQFAYTGIGDLTLGVGDYVVGASYNGGTDLMIQSASGIFSNDVNATFTGSHWDDQSGTLSFPANAYSGNGGNDYFGPGVHLAQVPEPASLALLGLGLFGLGFSKRKKA